MQRKTAEVEQVKKQLADLQEEIKQKKGFSGIAEKDAEIKRLNDELGVQRSLNKNREQLLTELDQKSQQVRTIESSLRQVKSDLSLQEQQNKSLQDKLLRLQSKLDESDKKLNSSKEALFALEK